MKKNYIAPSIDVMNMNTPSLCAASMRLSGECDDLTGARSRYNNIEWLDDDDDEI